MTIMDLLGTDYFIPAVKKVVKEQDPGKELGIEIISKLYDLISDPCSIGEKLRNVPKEKYPEILECLNRIEQLMEVEK